MKIIVYDLETTGLNITNDKIIEAYFYDIVNSTCIHIICDPKIQISPEVSAIHGWTNLDLKGKKTFEQEIPKILEFCTEECVFIAHNNDNFDKLMLLTHLVNYGYKRPKTWKFVDTCKLANIAFPDMENYKQDTLQKKFNIKVSNNHKANKDVLDLVKIYEQICAELNLNTIKDITQIWKLSKQWKPVKMMFGKYKGTLIKDMPEDYKTWLKLNHAHNRELMKAIKG